MTYEWLKDVYLQPALKERTKYPENYNAVAPAGWKEKKSGIICCQSLSGGVLLKDIIVCIEDTS